MSHFVTVEKIYHEVEIMTQVIINYRIAQEIPYKVVFVVVQLIISLKTPGIV